MLERQSHILYAPDAAPDGVLPPHESAEQPLAGKVALVTGGSRDFGAALVRSLAAAGVNRIIAGYSGSFKKEFAAQETEASLGEYPGTYNFVPGNLTTPEGIDSLDTALDELVPEDLEDGKLDLLVLNAASKDRTINVEANHTLIDRFLPKMRKGGKIVFVQSVPGRYYQVMQPVGLIPDVYPVAESKDEADRSIENRLLEINDREVSLVRVVLPVFPDSSNIRLFSAQEKRRQRSLAARGITDETPAPTLTQTADALGLPREATMEEAAKHVVTLLEKNTGPDYVDLYGPYLDGRQTLKTIYGEPAIYVDVKNTERGTGRMIVTPDRASAHDEIFLTLLDTDGQTARGRFVVEDDDAEGHFAPESGLPLVLPGHKHIRAAVITMDAFAGNDYSAEEADNFSAQLLGFDGVTFKKAIKPGEEVTTIATLTDHQDDSRYKADVRIMVGNEVRTEINGLIVRSVENQPANTLLADQIIEFAAQSAAMNVFAKNPDKRPIFQSIGVTRFFGEDITSGMSLTAQEHKVTSDGKRIFSAASIITDQNGKPVGIIDDMTAMIISQGLLKRFLS